ncbi:SREBP regulating gene protein [Adelges cooleyi]|uniref:SREBP regulating gene protein n=1 Tax=Adelges cooleyi TaxID=133065 RepID=UPI00217F6537|nr:SREBP regulating gene protein [Adelges cooleyi]XP_050436325.1 SREBP regulating gene protein [Adelges cooleyi]
MWKDFLFSFIRRKIVLSVIFGCSLTYCIVSFLVIPPKPLDTWRLPTKVDHSSFVWISAEGESNNTVPQNCRNTVQGREYVADDRGYLCLRGDVQANNCCGSSDKRYICDTCNKDGCCVLYEHCVSCCLDPQKRKLLQTVLGKASETFRVLFAAINDHFELCLAKCRTNSQSVQHENTYLKPNKHCYTTADKVP